MEYLANVTALVDVLPIAETPLALWGFVRNRNAIAQENTEVYVRKY